MKMSQLARYDVPPEIISLWQEQESETLLPLQELAVKRHGLFDGGNLLIQAPTSSGKTFIGEMAALQTAMRRKKAVYLVPLKALAEEKYLDFKNKYEQYGVRVIVATRDHRQFDRDLEDGAFSIAIVVYEKLSQLLVRRPERLAEIELIIADELEILSDPERGAMAEVLLTRILQAQHFKGPARANCRLIGLSAVIGESDRLANWMDASLLYYERRPVELRYGVMHDGVFRYRTYNDFGEDEETLVGGHAESTAEMVVENVCAFAERGETCLVFVKAKEESRRFAETVAQRLDNVSAPDATAALNQLEPTRSRDCLLNTIQHGVAFHNADLSPEERRAVEDAFRRGEIRVMISTTTLAVGMNLPARNVFITSDKWQYDRRFGMPWKTPILRSEYENMGGRAGRYGAGYPHGRSILVAASPFEAETLWRRYVEGDRERIEPQLGKEPLENHVLQLIASRVCRTEEELQTFLEKTLTGQWEWLEILTVHELEFQLRAAVNRAIDAGMIVTNERNVFIATPLGYAVASKGVTIRTAVELQEWIAESETRKWIDLDLVLAAAMTDDGRMFHLALTGQEYEQADYHGQLKRLTTDHPLTPDTPLNRLRSSTLMPFFEEVRAIKIALLLSGWINHVPVGELEERFHTLKGQILGAAEQIGWLLDAARAVADVLGADETFVKRIGALAQRVEYGLKASALPVARVTGGADPRAQVLALENAGLTKPAAIKNASLDLLNEFVSQDDAKALKNWAIRALHDEDEQRLLHTHTDSVLVVNDARPGWIQIDGFRVRLEEKQYRLISLLATSPGICVAYDAIYEALWGDTVVEPGQISYQKSKLLKRIESVAPERSGLVHTVPKRGLMLNLTADEVEIRSSDALVHA